MSIRETLQNINHNSLHAVETALTSANEQAENALENWEKNGGVITPGTGADTENYETRETIYAVKTRIEYLAATLTVLEAKINRNKQ
ncbi:hypothetical protein HHJ78_10945 [Mobiluncus mulieris]|uniref:Uncharacterized protein n=1 Tax=Mobiluncus mulieris TaxID=2052 RepID=A0A7Y0Y539_9ACTO|nr:hypothetical protein [Mobiluncus mulieris]NMW66001.1 hypothetical protein [Mobiluncus mulieris]